VSEKASAHHRLRTSGFLARGLYRPSYHPDYEASLLPIAPLFSPPGSVASFKGFVDAAVIGNPERMVSALDELDFGSLIWRGLGGRIPRCSDRFRDGRVKPSFLYCNR
jgi:hypothetical protein